MKDIEVCLACTVKTTNVGSFGGGFHLELEAHIVQALNFVYRVFIVSFWNLYKYHRCAWPGVTY